MVNPTLLDPTWYITAFAGGAFGAAIGALPAFIFTGFMVIAGEALAVSGGHQGGYGPISDYGQSTAGVAVNAGTFTGYVGFGPIFGPHISFAAGAAAAAYAAKKGYIDDGKNILWAAGTNHIDVLLVGGIFGILGMVGTGLGRTVGFPTDNIATMVFLSALIHRVAFGYSVIGEVTGDGLFDVGPWERDEDEAPGIWLPWQYKWSGVAMIGLIGGIFGGALYYATGSALLGFGISAASLVFLQCGVDNIPVTHHITLPGSVGAWGAVAAGYSPTLVIIWGALFGIFGALMGEVLERVFYMHGGTHVDPPAGAIAASGLLSAVLTAAGVLGATFWGGLGGIGL
ncbi:hypothetical protein EGH24_00475 [Halonotius terrestris]|uniref:DUF7973 domain-containing protein n=1 Tax=Halonotius terrestris TaxID=2487750 RepID=A0A8J8PBE5_9EURY|nr:hypothetical protein [Halonotius terrestris]TQQ83314.1 hypothetical protein EGH24_00475 [Halonotius terrestris]